MGGAYAHHFYKFLDFLELRSLIITDLDSVAKPTGSTSYSGCLVKDGTHTSNAGIKNWFAKDTEGYYLLSECLRKTSEDKISGSRRIAYQISEEGKTAIGRSFEEALILANLNHFGVIGANEVEIEENASSKSPANDKKSEFALKYALEETSWTPPKYIVEGLQWLANSPNIPAPDVVEELEEVIAATSEAGKKDNEIHEQSKSE